MQKLILTLLFPCSLKVTHSTQFLQTIFSSTRIYLKTNYFLIVNKSKIYFKDENLRMISWVLLFETKTTVYSLIDNGISEFCLCHLNVSDPNKIANVKVLLKILKCKWKLC